MHVYVQVAAACTRIQSLYCSEPAKPNFDLQTPADFGNVVLAAKTIYKEITLRNKGAKAGMKHSKHHARLRHRCHHPHAH